MTAALLNYRARMQRVLDHIDRHLDGVLDLNAVSGVAAFSKYHFHRQFTATFGLSVHRYVQLAPHEAGEANGERIEAGTIPGGRCAVLRVVGNTDNLELAALYLYRDWLPASGEEARDFPLYCERVTFFPEVPEHEATADLFLPLK